MNINLPLRDPSAQEKSNDSAELLLTAEGDPPQDKQYDESKTYIVENSSQNNTDDVLVQHLQFRNA